MELLLSNLPIVTVIWSALTFCWGAYVNVSYQWMITFSKTFRNGWRRSDVLNSHFMLVVNISLILFLILEPRLSVINESIIIVNIFYNIYLIPASLTVLKWWKSRSVVRVPEYGDTTILM